MTRIIVIIINIIIFAILPFLIIIQKSSDNGVTQSTPLVELKKKYNYFNSF